MNEHLIKDASLFTVYCLLFAVYCLLFRHKKIYKIKEYKVDTYNINNILYYINKLA